MTIRKEKILFFALLIFFIGIRLFGVHLPYVQDEQKNAVHGVELAGIGAASGHPPLAGWIITAGGYFFGLDFLRLLPILFGIGSFLLLYLLIRVCVGTKAALWSGFLYAISPYGVFASLVVDLDGAVLPFFAVAAFLAYEMFHRNPERKRLWMIVLGIAILLGSLTKLSFVLVILALGADFILRLYALGKRRTALYIIGILIISPILIFGIAALSSLVFPLLKIRVVFGHVMDSVRFYGRSYSQVAYQLFKAILYLSPLLVIPALFISKKSFIILRPLALYLGGALLFYLVIFDFSLAALDKYLMIAVIPLCALSGVVLSGIDGKRPSRCWLITGFIFAAFLFFIQFLPHVVPPLYPKGEWLGRIFKLQWNFLVPFIGGSGPLGFYSSWLFLGISWLAVLGAGIVGFIRKDFLSIKPFIVIVGIAYSIIMLSDMLFGYPHGNSSKVLDDAIRYIRETPSVSSVVTYNDAGGYKIAKLGKYARRMMAVPKYEPVYKEFFKNYRGHVLVLDIPRIYQNSVYWRFISSCSSEFVSRSGYISATLYNCSKAVKP